jgi:hypothetical protein
MSLYYLRGGKYSNFHFFICVCLTIASCDEIINQSFLTVLLSDLQVFLALSSCSTFVNKILGSKKWQQASFISWQDLFYSFSVP